ncbi:hypothetical protein IRJ41_024254, partial [Triplophysa rosa]
VRFCPRKPTQRQPWPSLQRSRGPGVEDTGVPMNIPEFVYQEDDSVTLDAGEDFYDDTLQAGQMQDSPSASVETGGVDTGEDSFIDLFRRAAEKLSVDWPVPPPVQKDSRFGGYYLAPMQTVVRTYLPLYPDCLAELTSSWSKPTSPPPPVPGATKFTELEGAEAAGLISAPPMEHSLKHALQKHGYNKHSHSSDRPLPEQARTARALSSMSLLQTYQAICLGELSEAMSAGMPCDALMGEVRSTADYILRATRGVLGSLGHAMASTVVAQRHLWLTLANLPERDWSAFLSAPISSSGLFREGLGAFQARFEDSKKQTESLRGSMPRRFNAPGPLTANTGLRSVYRPPPAKRPAPVAAPRPDAWGTQRMCAQPRQQAGPGRRGPPPAKSGPAVERGISVSRQPGSSLGADKTLRKEGFSFEFMCQKQENKVLCSAYNASCLALSAESECFRNTNLAVRPRVDGGKRCIDVSYTASRASGCGDSPNNDGDPRCLPRTMARMRPSTMGASLDPVGLSTTVSFAPPLLRRGNCNISPRKIFACAERGNLCSPPEGSNSNGSAGEHGRRVFTAVTSSFQKRAGVYSLS